MPTLQMIANGASIVGNDDGTVTLLIDASPEQCVLAKAWLQYHADRAGDAGDAGDMEMDDAPRPRFHETKPEGVPEIMDRLRARGWR